jgi:hypothetical protein
MPSGVSAHLAVSRQPGKHVPVVHFEEGCGDTFLSHLFDPRFVLMPFLPEIIG